MDVELPPPHAELAQSVVGQTFLPVQGDGAVLHEQRMYRGEALVVEIHHIDAADFRPECATQGSYIVSVKIYCSFSHGGPLL